MACEPAQQELGLDRPAQFGRGPVAYPFGFVRSRTRLASGGPRAQGIDYPPRSR